METIGNRIKELRKEKRLTQKELAQILSITIPTLSHWECNYQEPASKDILAISNVFNVSTDYLLGRTDDPLEIVPIQSPTVPGLGAISLIEKDLILYFRRLPGETQDYIFGLLKNLAK